MNLPLLNSCWLFTVFNRTGLQRAVIINSSVKQASLIWNEMKMKDARQHWVLDHAFLGISSFAPNDDFGNYIVIMYRCLSLAWRKRRVSPELYLQEFVKYLGHFGVSVLELYGRNTHLICLSEVQQMMNKTTNMLHKDNHAITQHIDENVYSCPYNASSSFEILSSRLCTVNILYESILPNYYVIIKIPLVVIQILLLSLCHIWIEIILFFVIFRFPSFGYK